MESRRTPNKINESNAPKFDNFADLSPSGNYKNSPKPELSLDSVDVNSLIEQYESENSTVFRYENSKFKPLKVIAQEIKLVLEKQKSSEQVNNYVKVILPKYRSTISSLNKRLKIANTAKEKEELSEQIRTTYNNLLHSVAYALHDESVPVEVSESKSDEQKVKEFESTFTELKNEFREKGGRAEYSRNWLEVQTVLGFIENLGETEQDSAIRRVKMGRYLKNLKNHLDLFRQEIEEMSGNKVEVFEEGIADNNNNEAIADTEFDYTPNNLPIGSGEVFAGDLAEDVVKQPDVSYVSRNNTEETIDSNRYSVFSGDLAEDSTEPSYTYLPADKSELEKGYNPPPPDIEDAVVIEPENNPISLDVNVDDPSIEGFIRRRPVNESGNTISPKNPIEQNNLSNVTEDKDVTAEAKERSEWRMAKEVYKKSEQEYNEALNEYYKKYSEQYYANKSLIGKFGRGLDTAKKFFGLKPELPLNVDLLTKKENYREARSKYLSSLDKVLKNRAGYEVDGTTIKPNAKNYDFSIGSSENGDLNKMLFGKKFILDPNKKRLERQKQLLTPEEQGRLANIMAVMAKNKWLMRGGYLTLVGGVGFVSGGLGAAAIGVTYRAGRMAASTFLGAAAGSATRKWMQNRIDKTLSEAEAKTNNFSIRGLDRIEDELLRAYDEVEIKKMRKNAAGVFAAAATGFGAGMSASSFLSDVPDGANAESSPATPSVDNTAKAIEELAKETSKNSVDADNYRDERIISETSVDKAVPNYTESTTSTPTTEAVEAVEKILFEQKLDLDKFVTYDSAGNPDKVVTLSGVSFADDRQENPIPPSELPIVLNRIAEVAGKIISEDPNITKETLESNIATAIQNEFIGNDWWQRSVSDFPKIKIGEFTVAPADIDSLGVKVNASLDSEIPVENVESQIPVTESDEVSNIAPEEARKIYVTNSGEDLRTIVDKVFSDKLDGLNEYQKAAVLDRTMAMARVDEDLKNSLGLKSGDPELIYGGENIDLSRLGKELEHFADLSRKDMPLVNSGVVPIVTENDVSNIPIKVSSPEFDASLYTSEGGRDDVAEFVENNSSPSVFQDNISPESESVVTPPRPFSLSANMLENPEYQKFVEEKFGGVDRLNQIMNRTVENFDDSTYDYFEKSAIFGKDYESPYTYMSKMSLAEIDELREKTPDEIKGVLGAENIKYETYLAWQNKIDEMKEELPNSEQTTLKDLFSRYIAEKMDKKGNLIK